MKEIIIQIGLRLEDTLHRKIKIISAYERRSMNTQIEYAIQTYIENYEAKHGEIVFPEKK